MRSYTTQTDTNVNQRQSLKTVKGCEYAAEDGR